MTKDELMRCAEVLGEVAGTFANMPTEQAKSAEASLVCTLAQSYLVELAAHLADGMEPYEAFEATAKGIIEIPASKATVLKILTAKPKE